MQMEYEVLLIITTVVKGLSNKMLATMVSNYVGQVFCLFNAFDIIFQYA